MVQNSFKWKSSATAVGKVELICVTKLKIKNENIFTPSVW